MMSEGVEILKSDMSKPSTTALPRGYVYLIGAGPGDPELLTLKADRVLRHADVILYDDLVGAEVIARYSAMKIYTGKRKDSHHYEQDAINDELVHQALQGRKVARLKGGDPFIFGRGGEEIEVLRQHDIPYEIIPGITAAHGASAYTEIPLTMRKISSSVAFCTGHPVNKLQVPSADTLVYYMVASTVHAVLDALMAQGKDECTKVAVVQNATRYNQKIITGTLGELRHSDKAICSPALLIIGENINYFINDYWYSRKKKVLIVGDDSDRYAREEWVKVHFMLEQQAALEQHSHNAFLELECFDELYISSLSALQEFAECFKVLPQQVVITAATKELHAAVVGYFGVYWNDVD